MLLEQSAFTLESAPILSTYFTFSRPSLRSFAMPVLSVVSYRRGKTDHVSTLKLETLIEINYKRTVEVFIAPLTGCKHKIH